MRIRKLTGITNLIYILGMPMVELIGDYVVYFCSHPSLCFFQIALIIFDVSLDYMHYKYLINIF